MSELSSINPATGARVGAVGQTETDETDRMVVRARQAQPAWAY